MMCGVTAGMSNPTLSVVGGSTCEGMSSAETAVRLASNSTLMMMAMPAKCGLYFNGLHRMRLCPFPTFVALTYYYRGQLFIADGLTSTMGPYK